MTDIQTSKGGPYLGKIVEALLLVGIFLCVIFLYKYIYLPIRFGYEKLRGIIQ